MLATTRLEMIGSAAAGIAHDLNNQLTLILNYLEFADVEGARVATGRCCDLTGALLAYSRGEKPCLEPVDPVRFVHQFLNEIDLPATIQVVVDASEALPQIDADPVALHRVMTNLVSNAATAMSGSGKLVIVLRPGTISVEDTGAGIPAHDLAHVFQPFFTTKGCSGTGLGLAIVRDIMHQHGGSASVRSKVDEGTVFQLRFRLTQ